MTTTPLQRLRDVAGRSTALAPVHSGFGTLLEEVEPGRTTATIPALPPPSLRGPGAVLVLADLALSAAIATVLPAGRGLSTLTLHASTSGAPPRPGSALSAAGRLVHLDADSAVSTAEVRGADGEHVALLSCRCAVVPAPEGWGSGVEQDPQPDPFALLQVAGPPGVRSAVAAPLLANAAGAVQGGVLAALAGHVLDEVVGASRPHLAGAATDLDVTFLRGARADGGPLTARAEPVHAGRRLAAAGAELHDGAGRLLITAAAALWRGAPG